MSDSSEKSAWPRWKYLLHGTAFALLWPPGVLAGGILFFWGVWTLLFDHFFTIGLIRFFIFDALLLYATWRWLRWFFKKIKDGCYPRSFVVCMTPFFIPTWYVLIATIVFFFRALPAKALAVPLSPYIFTLDEFINFDGTLISFWCALLVTGLTALVAGLWFSGKAARVSGKIKGTSILLTVTGVLAACCAGGYIHYRTQMLAQTRDVQTIKEETSVMFNDYFSYSAHDSTDLTDYKPFSPSNKLVTIESPTLRITSKPPYLHGALSLYPVYAATAQALYAKELLHHNPGLVWTGTSPEAFNALIDGSCDMVFMLNPSEKQFAEAREKGKMLEITKIGREAFVFFVSRVNPVDGLTSTQIRDIYGKRVTNWKDVGGKSERIMPFQRPEGSGSQTAMLRFMGDAPLAKPVREEFQLSMGGIVNRVADYRNYGNAIGFSFRYYVEGLFKHDGVKLLAIDGVAPTVENIRSGAYPLVSDLVIVTAGSINPHIKEIIEWFLSSQGQELIEKVGYAPLGER